MPHPSYPQPRPKSKKNWMYKITQDYVYPDTGWHLSEDFDSQWLHISQAGVVTVKANKNGYAWDGCTPKISLFNLCFVGIPDGHVDYRTMKPYTYYASLVHDALYQYLDSVPIPKKDIDLLFLTMLEDFELRNVYYWAVKHFGGRGVIQKNI